MGMAGPADLSTASADETARFERKFNIFAGLGAGVWLLFLAPAFQEAWSLRGSVQGWLAILLLLAFCAVYVWSFIWARPFRHVGSLWRQVVPKALVAYLVLLGLSALIILLLGPNGLASVVYVAVAGIALLPLRIGLPGAAVLAVGSEWLARTVPGWEGADGIALSVALASFAVWGMWQAMRRSRDLAMAKDENAQLMLEQERARMARDLHDILGHSLTVIAVKAELADRLVDVSPERARAEIADIQRLSRDALADVRQTVDGYREVSLPAEITRARAALLAAGIEPELPGSTDEVPSERRELFAWALREGVTNVVRHSAARHCTVTLSPDRVVVSDDGRGPLLSATSHDGGHGLSGLRERAVAAGARVVTEAPTGGGFTLSVVVSADRAFEPMPTRDPALHTADLTPEPAAAEPAGAGPAAAESAAPRHAARTPYPPAPPVDAVAPGTPR